MEKKINKCSPPAQNMIDGTVRQCYRFDQTKVFSVVYKGHTETQFVIKCVYLINNRVVLFKAFSNPNCHLRYSCVQSVSVSKSVKERESRFRHGRILILFVYLSFCTTPHVFRCTHLFSWSLLQIKKVSISERFSL